MSSKKSTMRGIKNPQHVLCLQTVLKLAIDKWWLKLDFAGLGTSRSESVRSEIQLLHSFMKYDYEKLISPSFREFISFPLIYRFAGIPRVLRESEAEN